MAPERMGTGVALHLNAVTMGKESCRVCRAGRYLLSTAVCHGANKWLRTRYDELHMNAVVNWTKALKSDGTALGGVPSLFGTSLQVHTSYRACNSAASATAVLWPLHGHISLAAAVCIFHAVPVSIRSHVCGTR